MFTICQLSYFIVTLSNTEIIFSANSITNYIFITITIFIHVKFHTNTLSANDDVAHTILTSISVVQDQRNANPNVKSNATQRHLYTRKRNPEFDWSTADGTKAFAFCLHRKTARACTCRHVDWSGEIHEDVLRKWNMRPTMLPPWTRKMNGKEFDKERGNDFKNVFATPKRKHVEISSKTFRESPKRFGSLQNRSRKFLDKNEQY